MTQEMDANKLLKQAVSELRAGDHDSAIDLTAKIIETDPDHAGAHAIQFSAFFKSQRLEEARRMGTQAAKLNPRSVFILNNQACLQLEAKQAAAASGLLKSLIEQFGERGQWLYNLALAQRQVGNFEYAITTFTRTLDFEPEHDKAAFQLADCLNLVGDHEKAVAAYDYVRLLRHKHAPSHSNYIHQAAVNNTISARDIELELALWGERFIPADKVYDDRPSLNPQRPRVGFLLGKLPRHWTEQMVAPVANALASDAEVSIYWHDERMDQSLFDSQISIIPSAKFTDADFARRVRSDHVDALIDVCGMRIGSRQRALGLKVAAHQYGWLAHEGRYATPFVEVIDASFGMQPYAVQLTRHLGTKTIPSQTFSGIGCYRGVSDEVLIAWAAILKQCPNWNLHISNKQPPLVNRIKEKMERHGVEANRLVFATDLELTETTIALDNFVDNDPVALVEVLNKGGRVVAKRGRLYPAQHSEYILKQCRSEDWINNDTAQYIQQAIAMSQEPLGTGLSKHQLQQSGLSNIEEFSDRFKKVVLAPFKLES